MADQTAGTAETSGTAEKNPAEWVTGDEPATAAQRSYLGTLAREADQSVPEQLTKAEASETIDRLKEQSPRAAS